MAKVNCIIPAYNVGKYLNEAIDSVIAQTIGFQCINLVIVNDGSSDNTESIILNYQARYPNIYYIFQENAGVSAARNAGIAYCEQNLAAPYTCFLDGDDKYDVFQIERLYQFFERKNISNHMTCNSKKFDVAFIAIKTFEKIEDLHIAYKNIDRGKTRVINLKEENVFFSHVNNALFLTDSLKRERFDERLRISEDAQFLIKILLKTSRAGWLNDGETFYYLRKRNDGTSAIDNADSNPALYHRIAWYKEEFENYIEKYGEVPRLVQSSVLYDLHWFKSPNNDPCQHSINIDVTRAISDIQYMMKQISEDLIRQAYIPYWYKAYFMQLKYGLPNIISRVNLIEPMFCFGEHHFESISGTVHIKWVKQSDKHLIIRGFFIKSDYSEIELIAKFNGRKIDILTQDSYINDKKYYLGREIFPAKDFEINLKIPRLFANKKYQLTFYFKYKKKLFSPIELIHSWTSRFYDKNEIFVGEKVLVSTSDFENGFTIQKISNNKLFYNEIRRHKNEYEDTYLYSFFVKYFQTFRKKRIWLFIDRPTAVGDNAEALFRYASKIRDGIEKFMVIPDASYFPKFKGVNARIIIYGSFEYKFLLMFAEKVISSTTYFESVYYKTNISADQFKKIAQALSSPQHIFLQHGITKDYGIVKSYLNQSDKDIDLLITASKKETELFLSKEAGFNLEQVKLTGFPRYDLLESKSEKIITFIPTWRNKYAHDDDSYNQNFKQTDLFHDINQFINDQHLLALLRRTDYRLVFKVHPKMQVQIPDFNTHKNVAIVANEISYHELYEKSAIMITDFSSAVFDFAYLKKPVIYYQSIEPEYEQDETLFSYENDGFGHVYVNKNQVIKKIADYIEQDCVMEEVYQKRVDNFFVYRDQNNSKRVYDEIKKLPSRVRYYKTKKVIEKVYRKINHLFTRTNQ